MQMARNTVVGSLHAFGSACFDPTMAMGFGGETAFLQQFLVCPGCFLRDTLAVLCSQFVLQDLVSQVFPSHYALGLSHCL